MPVCIRFWGLASVWVVSLLALSACGKSLDQALTCSDFKRLPDGRWVTVKDVAISYGGRIAKYNLGYGKGLIITGTDSEGARLLAALNKVCK
jgi:hypothetical protein